MSRCIYYSKLMSSESVNRQNMHQEVKTHNDTSSTLQLNQIDDFKFTEETLKLMQDKLLQAIRKQNFIMQHVQIGATGLVGKETQNNQICYIDCEHKDTNQIQDKVSKNLPVTQGALDEFLDQDLDGYLDNILETNEGKSDQNASAKTQKQTKNQANTFHNNSQMQLKPATTLNKESKKTEPKMKKQFMEQKMLAVPIVTKNQQNQSKTNKIPIFFNSDLIPDEIKKQKLHETKNLSKMVKNVQPTESNKSDSEFSKMIAQTMYKPHAKKNTPPPIIEILSDEQLESNMRSCDRVKLSAVSSQEMARLQKNQQSKNPGIHQDKRQAIMNRSNKDSYPNSIYNPSNFQKNQYRTEPEFPVSGDNENKKQIIDKKLVLQIKEKIIKNAPSVPQQNNDFIEKLKEKLKTTSNMQAKNIQPKQHEKNLTFNRNLETLTQYRPNNKQQAKNNNSFKKQLKECMFGSVQDKQQQIKEVKFQIVIQLLPPHDDTGKKISTHNSLAEISGPKNTSRITQKMFALNSQQNQQLKTVNPQPAQESPQNFQRNIKKVYHLIKNWVYSQFIARRTMDQSGVIDLGVLSIEEVVEQSHSNKIISDEVYTQFLTYHSEQKILEFLDYFTENKLQSWNYNQLKITIMDHRRLSQLLVRLHPKKYRICSPLALNQNIKLFLKNLYSLQSPLYKHTLQIIDTISKLSLWTRLSMKYKHLEMIPVEIHQSPLNRDSKKSIS